MRSRFSPAALRVFDLFFEPWRRRRIAATRIAGLPRSLPAGVPLVFASQHLSWWDPFTLREVHRLLRPRAPVWSLMTESELRRFPLLSQIGAFGMDPARPASVLRAMRWLAARLRERPDSSVVFFPQGRMWPSHRRPLAFHRGIEVFARAIGSCAILPVALHHEPLNAPAPTVFVSAARPVMVDGDADHRALESAVEAESDRILDFLSRHGEDAPARWPDPFERLESPSLPVASPAVVR
jgi:hypothetical protein